MRTRTFWVETGERAVKTLAQAALITFIGTDPDAIGFDSAAADWSAVASFAFGGALLSVLTSIISAPMGHRGSPSLVTVAPPASDLAR